MIKKLAIGLLALFGILLLVLFGRAARFNSRQTSVSPAANLSFDREAALQRLSQAIQFRTVSSGDPAQPPSQEFRRFHDFLSEAFPRVARRLERETVGAHSLLYTWKGAESGPKPMLLMAHMDVIPAPDQDWRHPPFSGARAEGYVWGRGTMDDKASLMAMLEAVEYLLASGFAPLRTVFLAFGHDEELGGQNGAGRIAGLLRARRTELEFVLDEGMNILSGIVPGISAPVALVGTAEKGYLSLRLTTKTGAGHSSLPPAATAIGLLAAAVSKLEADPFPSRLSGPIRQMLEYLGPEMDWRNKVALANLWLFDPLVRRQLTRSPVTNAAVRTTMAPTIFNAGTRENVLPTNAEAVVNLRLLPGDTIAGATERVRRVIAEPKITITPLPVQLEPSSVSDARSPSFELLQRTIRQIAPDTLVAPALLVAATDSRHYAGLSKSIYRFLPITLGPNDANRYHGIDERISLEDYERCIRFYAQLIRNSQP